MAKFYANFGSSKTGIATVGYAQRDGVTVVVARTTVGVVEVGGGVYMVDLATGITSPATGLLWDTGEGTPVFAFEDLKADLMIKIGRNRRETNPDTGIQTIFDDDGVTPLISGPIFEDIDGTTPYSATSDGIDRQNRLI